MPGRIVFRVVLVSGLLVAGVVLGGYVGRWIGLALCDEPADAFLRCIGFEVLGWTAGAVTGAIAAIAVSILVLRPSRRAQRALLAGLAAMLCLALGFGLALLSTSRDDRQFHAGSPSPRFSVAFTDNRSYDDEDDDRILVIGAGSSTLAVLVDDAAHPAWSPDGRRVAFERKSTATADGEQVEQDDIWVADADGTGQLRLTNDPAEDHEAAWSPDGKLIAFVSSRLAWADVFVMRPDGSGVRRLTRGGWEDRDVAWSPDGRRIAFARNGAIWVLSLEGASPRRLAAPPTQGLTYSEPDWSPDGRSIAFAVAASSVTGGDEYSEIWVMSSDGTGRRPLTNDLPGHAWLLDDEPDWSPNGRWIVFERSVVIGCCEDGIWAMDPDGRNAHRVTEGDHTDPKWRPHGRRTR